MFGSFRILEPGFLPGLCLGYFSLLQPVKSPYHGISDSVFIVNNTNKKQGFVSVAGGESRRSNYRELLGESKQERVFPGENSFLPQSWVELCLPQKICSSPSPWYMQCGLIWKWDPCRCNHIKDLKVILDKILAYLQTGGVGLKSSAWYP